MNSSFRYSQVERDALIAAIPLPAEDARGEWAQNLRCENAEKAMAMMPQVVASVLEVCANKVLTDKASQARRTPAEDAEIVSRIGKTAAKLLQDLSRSTIASPKIAYLFFMEDPQRFLRELEYVKRVANEIEQVQGRVHIGDPFGKKHNPELHEFVHDAVRTWETWSGSIAGSSRTGGPCARFICAACNPVIAFADRNNLGDIRKDNHPIDDAEAGRLIKLSKISDA